MNHFKTKNVVEKPLTLSIETLRDLTVGSEFDQNSPTRTTVRTCATQMVVHLSPQVGDS